MSLVSTRDFKKITIQLGDMIQSAGIYHLIYLAYIRYPSFFLFYQNILQLINIILKFMCCSIDHLYKLFLLLLRMNKITT